MIVDRRKDSYDELQILAGDVRTRRRRANIVTTILLSGGIVGTAAFIATMNQQVDALAAEVKEAETERISAETERDALRVALQDVDNRLAELRAQAYQRLAEHVANIANGESINPIGPIIFPDEIEITGIPDEIRINGEMAGAQTEVINLVYIVDGSRRFPMTRGDVLWIPEAQFWVRLEEGDPPNGGEITRHFGASAPNRDAEGETIFIGDLRNPTLIDISGGNNQGATNCLTLALGEVSREGFGFRYFDMDVRLLPNSDCPAP